MNMTGAQAVLECLKREGVVSYSAIPAEPS
mgnify:CR=1 FL=1